MNVYILVSDNRKELTIDGSLELFGQLLSTIQRGAPEAERKPVRTNTSAVKSRGEILHCVQDDICGRDDSRGQDVGAGARLGQRVQSENLVEGDA